MMTVIGYILVVLGSVFTFLLLGWVDVVHWAITTAYNDGESAFVVTAASVALFALPFVTGLVIANWVRHIINK